MSVVVPVFDTKPYLRKCLDSLSSQTLPGVEVICVDNGSTDGSYEFLVSYSRDHPNVTVMRHAEGRQGGARNAGIERARACYIGFVDSDDFVSPDMYRVMYQAARATRADVVICNIEFYYEDQAPSRHVLPSALLQRGEPFPIQQRPQLLRNLTICNRLFSREFIEAHALRFPTGVFHEDQFLVAAALTSARRIVTVPSTLYFYRRNRAGSVNEYTGSDNMHVFEVMRSLLDFVDAEGMDASIRRLVDEVRALRYLLLYRSTATTSRRRYFERMREEVRDLPIPVQPQLLSPWERRELKVAQRYGYTAYNLLLQVRRAYRNSVGVLRTAAR